MHRRICHAMHDVHLAARMPEAFLNVKFKSNARETWHAILVSFADIYPTESLCILAERLSQSEIVLPLRKTCYYSPLAEVGVFSTEINRRFAWSVLNIIVFFIL